MDTTNKQTNKEESSSTSCAGAAITFFLTTDLFAMKMISIYIFEDGPSLLDNTANGSSCPSSLFQIAQEKSQSFSMYAGRTPICRKGNTVLSMKYQRSLQSYN